MSIAAARVKTLDSASVGPARRAPEFPPASPEEGHRLVSQFLRVQSPEQREEIQEFVAKMLRLQDVG